MGALREGTDCDDRTMRRVSVIMVLNIREIAVRDGREHELIDGVEKGGDAATADRRSIEDTLHAKVP